MAKKKFYAVKVGREPGIYTEWPLAQAQIAGFPNACFKGFSTENEARAFLSIETHDDPEPDAARETGVELPADGPYAFVDGSYNPDTRVYGFGGFLVANGEEHVLQGHGDDPEMASMRNVAGEISGALAAVDAALAAGVDRLTIYHDYNGIRDWATGAWKANKPGTRRYRDRMAAAQSVIAINFVHTPGHTGIPGNERADALAKESVGL